MLCEARRPLILAGNGCIRKRANRQLRALCEKTGIGVVSTFMAKGCVDMDAPYCLYTIGLGSRDRVSQVVDDSDLVITLGFDMVEYHPERWNARRDKTIIHVDFVAAEIDAHYHPQAELLGDVAHALWMLNERIDEHGLPEYDLSEQQATREALAEQVLEGTELVLCRIPRQMDLDTLKREFTGWLEAPR